MAWDYDKGQVHLYMPGYVQRALKLFQHTCTKTQNHSHTSQSNMEPKFNTLNRNPRLPPPTEKKFIQKVCGKFLFYGRAIDSTVLTPISAIASQSANPTKETLAHTNQLLNYLATQEKAVLTYNCSEMVMAVHSDASYLCKPKAKSRAGGHFLLIALKAQ